MKIVRNFNQFINEELSTDDMEMNNQEVVNELEEEIGGESSDHGDDNIESSDIIEDNEDVYVGDKAMQELAMALDVEYNGNRITYEGYKIEYVSEFDGFNVRGNGINKKIPVKSVGVPAAVEEVMEIVGAMALTEKQVHRWIKTNPKEKGKYDDKNIGDLEEEKEELMDRNAKHKGKVPQRDKEKMAELNFALRAKRGHGFKK